MSRYCYCSKILPRKQKVIVDHWAQKTSEERAKWAKQFWGSLGMTSFESWLQPSANLMIHCLEGDSFAGIFKKLREQIRLSHPIACELQAFYQEVLGKDYALLEIEPKIELVFDVELSPFAAGSIKKGFVYPLLPHKEQEHRKFRLESMNKKRKRHEASMRAFGVSRLSTWLQSTPEGKYVVVYSEREANCPTTAQERLACGKESLEWQEIAKELIDHTGLQYQDLSPEVLWLSKN